LSIQHFFYRESSASQYGGGDKETTLYGATPSINEPTGVIRISCPEKAPGLSFVSLFGSAIV
jgi:hypothetical protein